MKIEISKLTNLAISKLIEIGFQKEEAEIVALHLVEAELLGKKGHGISRIKHFKDKLGSEMFDPNSPEPVIEKETSVSLRVNGYSRSGIYTIEKFLEYAIENAKQVGMYSVASTFGVNSGSIGIYARKAVEKDLIFIGFHNSSGGLIPHGAIKDIWGTNPLTIGIPSKEDPFILDFASTKITYGDILQALKQNKDLPTGTILDENGNPSNKPEDGWNGGLLAMAEHKGSGLGMAVELLAGALSLSRVGYNTKGGWGSFFILINPEIFRPIYEFKEVVDQAIIELKSLPKADGVDEIYYPGEQSLKMRNKAVENGTLDLDEDTHALLVNKL